MGVQFERITYSPRHSLTLIVDDIARHRRDVAHRAVAVDLDAWVNALHRQSQPLIASKGGQQNLLAWLDAVDEALPASE